MLDRFPDRLFDRLTRPVFHRPIPPDLLERIAALGKTAANYEWHRREGGSKSVRAGVEFDEKAAALAAEWGPKLHAFAAEKRAAAPIPTGPPPDAKTAARRAIVAELLDAENAERVPRRSPHTVLIFTAPLDVLPELARRWPGSAANAALLTPAESRAWSEVYEHAGDDPWWFACQHWDVEAWDASESMWTRDWETKARTDPGAPPGRSRGW